MHLLEIDILRNRVHITYSGNYNAAQAKDLYEELKGRSGELKKGFCLLCDMTALSDVEHGAKRSFRAIMDLCNELGVSRVVRIVPNPLYDFGLTIMSCFHYDNGVKVLTCKTLDEALEHL